MVVGWILESSNSLKRGGLESRIQWTICCVTKRISHDSQEFKDFIYILSRTSTSIANTSYPSPSLPIRPTIPPRSLQTSQWFGFRRMNSLFWRRRKSVVYIPSRLLGSSRRRVHLEPRLTRSYSQPQVMDWMQTIVSCTFGTPTLKSDILKRIHDGLHAYMIQSRSCVAQHMRSSSTPEATRYFNSKENSCLTFISGSHHRSVPYLTHT